MSLVLRQLLLVTLLLCGLHAAAAERTTYYIPDAQGSPVAAMDEQGNLLWRESYAPYGERRTRPAGNKAANAYTGKPEDTFTGLVYMGARWYDPETARFTGIDPQGFVEGNPQSFGRYVYANNSPYRYADPNGESPVDVLFLAYDAASFATAAYSGNPVAMWESGADLAASFVGVMSPVPGTGEAIKALRAADKIKESGRVFWSGGSKAKDAAEAYAKANGKQTLEMSAKGKALEQAQHSMSSAEAQRQWAELSREWAEGAKGEVDTFIHQPRYDPSRNWGTVEKPILMQDPEVTRINYHDVH